MVMWMGMMGGSWGKEVTRDGRMVLTDSRFGYENNVLQNIANTPLKADCTLCILGSHRIIPLSQTKEHILRRRWFKCCLNGAFETVTAGTWVRILDQHYTISQWLKQETLGALGKFRSEKKEILLTILFHFFELQWSCRVRLVAIVSSLLWGSQAYGRWYSYEWELLVSFHRKV